MTQVAVFADPFAMTAMSDDSVYAAILSRLDAQALQQHYEPLFREHLQAAHSKLLDAVAAVERLQGMHASMLRLEHPQSEAVAGASTPLMALAKRAVDVQQELAAAIAERLANAQVRMPWPSLCMCVSINRVTNETAVVVAARRAAARGAEATAGSGRTSQRPANAQASATCFAADQDRVVRDRPVCE